MTHTGTPALDDLATPEAMRDRVLVALADYVLTRHAEHLAVLNGLAEDGALDVSPAAALVAIIEDARASFDLEPVITLDEARILARETWEYTAAMVPAVVGRNVAQARRVAGLRYG